MLLHCKYIVFFSSLIDGLYMIPKKNNITHALKKLHDLNYHTSIKQLVRDKLCTKNLKSIIINIMIQNRICAEFVGCSLKAGILKIFRCKSLRFLALLFWYYFLTLEL